MTEMRAYWCNRWFNEIIPDIKQILVELTPLPEDIVCIIPEYFEYPYEVTNRYLAKTVEP